MKTVYHGEDCRVFFPGNRSVDLKVDFVAPAGMFYAALGCACMEGLRDVPELVPVMLAARDSGWVWVLLPLGQVVAFVRR